eukprot:363725-Chlamydomonas_euryale.AAC.12
MASAASGPLAKYKLVRCRPVSAVYAAARAAVRAARCCFARVGARKGRRGAGLVGSHAENCGPMSRHRRGWTLRRRNGAPPRAAHHAAHRDAGVPWPACIFGRTGRAPAAGRLRGQAGACVEPFGAGQGGQVEGTPSLRSVTPGRAWRGEPHRHNL